MSNGETLSHEHPVIRATRLANDAVLARDWDAFAGFFAESWQVDDRRVGLKSLLDKAEHIEQLRVGVDLGLDKIDIDLLDTRGDRFALYRLTFHVETDFVVSVLCATEADENGLLLRSVVLDDGALDAGRVELEALAAETI